VRDEPGPGSRTGGGNGKDDGEQGFAFHDGFVL
jgi:hypothetical protein